jgi:hypothetical protein
MIAIIQAMIDQFVLVRVLSWAIPEARNSKVGGGGNFDSNYILIYETRLKHH